MSLWYTWTWASPSASSSLLAFERERMNIFTFLISSFRHRLRFVHFIFLCVFCFPFSLSNASLFISLSFSLLPTLSAITCGCQPTSRPLGQGGRKMEMLLRHISVPVKASYSHVALSWGLCVNTMKKWFVVDGFSLLTLLLYLCKLSQVASVTGRSSSP